MDGLEEHLNGGFFFEGNKDCAAELNRTVCDVEPSCTWEASGCELQLALNSAVTPAFQVK